MIDFRAVGILDRQYLPFEGDSKYNPDTLSQKVENLGVLAASRGMQACYIRVYDVEPQALRIIVDTMRNFGIPIIVPAQYIDHHLDVEAYHFREKDEIELKVASKIYGKSCHSLESIIEAETKKLDYVYFSPIFRTRTHPEAAPVGLEALTDVCRQVKIPVFALGGISKDNYSQCLSAGAYGYAAISMFFSEN